MRNPNAETEPEEIVTDALAAARAAHAPVDDIVGMELQLACPAGSRASTCRSPCFIFVLLFPFYWMAITAIKPDHQLTNYTEYSPFWVVGPTLEHIQYLLFETSYPGWLWNTMLVAFCSTVISLAASVFAAYAIERLRFTGSRVAGLADLPRLSRAAVDPVHPARLHRLQGRHLRHQAGADPHLPDLPDPVLHLAADGLLPHHPVRARGKRAGRRRHALADPDHASSCRSRCRG